MYLEDENPQKGKSEKLVFYSETADQEAARIEGQKPAGQIIADTQMELKEAQPIDSEVMKCLKILEEMQPPPDDAGLRRFATRINIKVDALTNPTTLRPNVQDQAKAVEIYLKRLGRPMIFIPKIGEKDLEKLGEEIGANKDVLPPISKNAQIALDFLNQKTPKPTLFELENFSHKYDPAITSADGFEATTPGVQIRVQQEAAERYIIAHQLGGPTRVEAARLWLSVYAEKPMNVEIKKCLDLLEEANPPLKLSDLLNILKGKNNIFSRTGATIEQQKVAITEYLSRKLEKFGVKVTNMTPESIFIQVKSLEAAKEGVNAGKFLINSAQIHLIETAPGKWGLYRSFEAKMNPLEFDDNISGSGYQNLGLNLASLGRWSAK